MRVFQNYFASSKNYRTNRWVWSVAMETRTRGWRFFLSSLLPRPTLLCHYSFLPLTDQKHEHAKQCYPSIPKFARVYFRYGSQSEGYWNCERFLIQTENSVQIAGMKYPKCNRDTGVLLCVTVCIVCSHLMRMRRSHSPVYVVTSS